MKGSYLSVNKFQHVDYWFRKYRNDPILASVLDSIIKYKEDGYRKIFSELYTWEEGKLFNEIKGHLNDISGSIFCSEFISAEGTKGSISNNRSEENKSELQSLMRISYDVFCVSK